MKSSRESKTAIPIAVASLRWRRLFLAETDASDLASATCYRRSKHIGIAAVVVPELKFSDIQRQIFGAHFVECADNAALEDAPKSLNRVRMHRSDDVFVVRVPDDLVTVAVDLPQAVIADPLIGHEQTDFFRNRFGHELGKFVAGHAAEHAGDHVALAGDGTDNRHLARPDAATARTTAPFGVVLVLGLAAYERLINLHDAAKLLFRRDQRGANLVAHGMGRLVAAKAHHALNLKGAHSLLARQHQMGDAEPVSERLFGVLKNRPGERREPIAVFIALAALPVKRFVAGSVVKVCVTASRALHAQRPTTGNKVAKARRVVPNRETVLELGRGHLRNWLRTICHDGFPSNLSVEGYCHA